MAKMFLTLIRFYQIALRGILASQFGPHQCRFEPSCSEYAASALRNRGPLLGTWLAAKRLCRCHPFAAGGLDPLPKQLAPQNTYRFS